MTLPSLGEIEGGSLPPLETLDISPCLESIYELFPDNFQEVPEVIQEDFDDISELPALDDEEYESDDNSEWSFAEDLDDEYDNTPDDGLPDLGSEEGFPEIQEISGWEEPIEAEDDEWGWSEEGDTSDEPEGISDWGSFDTSWDGEDENMLPTEDNNDPDVAIFTEILEDGPIADSSNSRLNLNEDSQDDSSGKKHGPKGIWNKIKADFSNGDDTASVDDSKEEEEEEESTPSKKKAKGKKKKGKGKNKGLPKKALQLLLWPFNKASKVVLWVLSQVLNVFSKVPLVGPLVSQLLRSSGLLKLLSKVITAFILVYAISGFATSSVPSSFKASLPDSGEATFSNFRHSGDSVTGVITNQGEVVAEVDAIFKVYTYSPNLREPGTWISLKEAGECAPVEVTIDIDQSVDVESICPPMDLGIFSRVTGVLSE